MRAQLIESEQEHHWVLLDHRITSLSFDAQSVRIASWSLDSSAEIRLVAPFSLRITSDGADRTLDPSHTESLAPVLALMRRPLTSITVSHDGELAIELDGGTRIVARPHSRIDAWDVQGGGTLEGLLYRCMAGGGRSW
jgi:hypothetical protein